jgi:site-specific DNA recombinase
MKTAAAKPQRCAIYTRKSTEHNLDLAFNSLDAQREACGAYIKSQAHEGWRLIADRFDDGGLSGASLERPALQGLLEQVRSRKIDIIVVYKVDRLTRSLADFAKLVELFDEFDVSFVSVTQSFNTTSSMGRLTLNVLLSFAQFEREVIGERVRDKIAASKRKGIWVGGPIPLGYQSVGKKLKVVPDEAGLVRKIFADYLRLGSIGELAAALDREGVRPRPRKLASGKIIAAERFWSVRSRICLKIAFMSAKSPIAARSTRASTSRSSIAISSTPCRRDWPKAPSSESSRDHVTPPCSSVFSSTIAAIP